MTTFHKVDDLMLMLMFKDERMEKCAFTLPVSSLDQMCGLFSAELCIVGGGTGKKSRVFCLPFISFFIQTFL